MDQPEQISREGCKVAPDRVAARTEARDEQGSRSSRFPDRLRTGTGVVADSRSDCETEQDADTEEKENPELLRALGCSIQPDERGQRGDEPQNRPAARGIPADVGTERKQTGGDGDEAHRLSEQSSCFVACAR